MRGEYLIVRKFAGHWNVMASSYPWKPLASFLHWHDAIETALDLIMFYGVGLYFPSR